MGLDRFEFVYCTLVFAAIVGAVNLGLGYADGRIPSPVPALVCAAFVVVAVAGPLVACLVLDVLDARRAPQQGDD